MSAIIMPDLTHEDLSPLSDVTEPKWWTGSPALDAKQYVIDGQQYRVNNKPLEPSQALADHMQQTYDDVGLIHVVNTGLEDFQAMRKIATLVLKNQRSYEGGANPRKALEKNVYEVGAPLEAWLHYHHEMAYIGSSTRMVGFMAPRMPKEGGYTYVSDGVQVTNALMATPLGEKLKKLRVCYHRDLTDRESFVDRLNIGVYNHWQQSMLTEDPDEAIAEARSRGLEAEWGPNRLLKTRFTVSAFEYFPPMDRNLLYCSMADDGAWFDTWPLVQHLPPEERPLRLTFGDGSEFSPEEKRQFIDIYGDYGMPIAWKTGDIAVMCNYRFAHGRPSIHLKPGEHRELGVLIGESFDRVEDCADKW